MVFSGAETEIYKLGVLSYVGVQAGGLQTTVILLQPHPLFIIIQYKWG